MSSWNANIPQLVDGVSVVNSATINGLTNFLAGRDQYLFDQLNNYNDKTLIVSFNNPLATNYPVGTPVYFNSTSGTPVLTGAQAGYGSSITPAHLTPNDSSYVFGLVKTVYSGPASTYYGDVYVFGLITDIDLTNVLDSQSITSNPPLPGPIYLSSIEPGKLSTIPNGASVFVGYVVSDTTLFLSPKSDSLNQLYFNYKLFLNPEPAGTSVLTTGTWAITGGNVAKTGWISTADATSLLGLTPPTGALFYYNIASQTNILADSTLSSTQKSEAILLKEALPAYPAAYTMLFANGVLQTSYSTDHTSGAYIVNPDGIWWTLNADGYQPWSTNSFTLTLQLLVTKLNPEYAAAVVTSLTSSNSSIIVKDANTGQPATSGDLALQLNLSVNSASGTNNGSALQTLTFNPSNSQLTAATTTVINTVTAGPGLVATNNNGALLLSLSNYALTGDVDDIEPEESDFVYKGLHSYLRLKNPVLNQRVGLVGKFKLPSSLPSGLNLNILLQAFADNATAPTSTVPFVFEYALSKPGALLSTALTSSIVPIVYNSGSPIFLANTLSTVFQDSSSNVFFQIPAAQLTPSSYVNFRISRINTSANASTYSSGIGILAVTWLIQ